MTKARCPIEKDNIRKGLEKCPLESMCNNSYKEICQYNQKLINKFQMVV